MAVDTKNKRYSLIDLLPEPDGTIDGTDREQYLESYPGVQFSSVTHGGSNWGFPAVPVTGQEVWASDATSILSLLVDFTSALVAGAPAPDILGHNLTEATTVVTGGSTLTPTKNIHKLSATAPVTLGGLAAPTPFGEFVALVGSSDTNTVTVPKTGTMKTNCTLGNGDALVLWADKTSWVELFRTV